MVTGVDVGYLIDIFDTEGKLFKHSYGHDVGIVCELSCQMPHDYFGDPVGLIHTNTQPTLFLDLVEVFQVGLRYTL